MSLSDLSATAVIGISLWVLFCLLGNLMKFVPLSECVLDFFIGMFAMHGVILGIGPFPVSICYQLDMA